MTEDWTIEPQAYCQHNFCKGKLVPVAPGNKVCWLCGYLISIGAKFIECWEVSARINLPNKEVPCNRRRK